MAETPADAQLPRAMRPAVLFVVFTVFIDSLTIGLAMPVIPQLVMELGETDVSGAAFWGGIAGFAFALMQFVFSPILGALSDAYGRRPILMLSLAGLMLDMLLLAVADTIWMFLLARLLAGIFAATFSTAYAFLSDVTTPEGRTRGFGYVSAAFGAGFIVGPAAGGLLVDVSLRAPFLFAAALAAANLIFGLFVMRESLTAEHRRAFAWARATTVGALRALQRAVPPARPGATASALTILIVVYSLNSLSEWVYPSVWSYVTIAKFNWDAGDIGLSLTAYGVLSIFGQVVLINWLRQRMTAADLLRLAMGLEALSLVGIALAPGGAFLYMFLSLAVISSTLDPALRSVMSTTVPASAQGELQGGLSALASLSMIAAPILYTQTFTHVSGPDAVIQFPGLPMLIAAAFSIAAFLVFRRWEATAPDAETVKAQADWAYTPQPIGPTPDRAHTATDASDAA